MIAYLELGERTWTEYQTALASCSERAHSALLRRGVQGTAVGPLVGSRGNALAGVLGENVSEALAQRHLKN